MKLVRDNYQFSITLFGLTSAVHNIACNSLQLSLVLSLVLSPLLSYQTIAAPVSDSSLLALNQKNLQATGMHIASPNSREPQSNVNQSTPAECQKNDKILSSPKVQNKNVPQEPLNASKASAETDSSAKKHMADPILSATCLIIESNNLLANLFEQKMNLYYPDLGHQTPAPSDIIELDRRFNQFKNDLNVFLATPPPLIKFQVQKIILNYLVAALEKVSIYSYVQIREQLRDDDPLILEPLGKHYERLALEIPSSAYFTIYSHMAEVPEDIAVRVRSASKAGEYLISMAPNHTSLLKKYIEGLSVEINDRTYLETVRCLTGQTAIHAVKTFTGYMSKTITPASGMDHPFCLGRQGLEIIEPVPNKIFNWQGVDLKMNQVSSKKDSWVRKNLLKHIKWADHKERMNDESLWVLERGRVVTPETPGVSYSFGDNYIPLIMFPSLYYDPLNKQDPRNIAIAAKKQAADKVKKEKVELAKQNKAKRKAALKKKIAEQKAITAAKGKTKEKSKIINTVTNHDGVQKQATSTLHLKNTTKNGAPIDKTKSTKTENLATATLSKDQASGSLKQQGSKHDKHNSAIKRTSYSPLYKSHSTSRNYNNGYVKVPANNHRGYLLKSPSTLWAPYITHNYIPTPEEVLLKQLKSEGIATITRAKFTAWKKDQIVRTQHINKLSMNISQNIVDFKSENQLSIFNLFKDQAIQSILGRLFSHEINQKHGDLKNSEDANNKFKERTKVLDLGFLLLFRKNLINLLPTFPLSLAAMTNQGYDHFRLMLNEYLIREALVNCLTQISDIFSDHEFYQTSEDFVTASLNTDFKNGIINQADRNNKASKIHKKQSSKYQKMWQSQIKHRGVLAQEFSLRAIAVINTLMQQDLDSGNFRRWVNSWMKPMQEDYQKQAEEDFKEYVKGLSRASHTLYLAHNGSGIQNIFWKPHLLGTAFAPLLAEKGFLTNDLELNLYKSLLMATNLAEGRTMVATLTSKLHELKSNTKDANKNMADKSIAGSLEQIKKAHKLLNTAEKWLGFDQPNVDAVKFLHLWMPELVEQEEFTQSELDFIIAAYKQLQYKIKFNQYPLLSLKVKKDSTATKDLNFVDWTAILPGISAPPEWNDDDLEPLFLSLQPYINFSKGQIAPKGMDILRGQLAQVLFALKGLLGDLRDAKKPNDLKDLILNSVSLDGLLVPPNLSRQQIGLFEIDAHRSIQPAIFGWSFLKSMGAYHQNFKHNLALHIGHQKRTKKLIYSNFHSPFFFLISFFILKRILPAEWGGTVLNKSISVSQGVIKGYWTAFYIQYAYHFADIFSNDRPNLRKQARQITKLMRTGDMPYSHYNETLTRVKTEWEENKSELQGLLYMAGFFIIIKWGSSIYKKMKHKQLEHAELELSQALSSNAKDSKALLSDIEFAIEAKMKKDLASLSGHLDQMGINVSQRARLDFPLNPAIYHERLKNARQALEKRSGSHYHPADGQLITPAVYEKMKQSYSVYLKTLKDHFQLLENYTQLNIKHHEIYFGTKPGADPHAMLNWLKARCKDLGVY